MLPPPGLLAAALLLGLVVLLPTRRLWLAGLPRQVVALYALLVWALAFFLVVRPAGLRILGPILVIAFIAPFVVAPERVSSLVRRRRGRGDPPRPPMKNVTPPDERSRLP